MAGEGPPRRRRSRSCSKKSVAHEFPLHTPERHVPALVGLPSASIAAGAQVVAGALYGCQFCQHTPSTEIQGRRLGEAKRRDGGHDKTNVGLARGIHTYASQVSWVQPEMLQSATATEAEARTKVTMEVKNFMLVVDVW